MLDRKLRMLSKEAAPDELMLNRDTRKVKKLFKTKKVSVYLFVLQPNNSIVHKTNHKTTTKMDRDQLRGGDIRDI